MALIHLFYSFDEQRNGILGRSKREEEMLRIKLIRQKAEKRVGTHHRLYLTDREPRCKNGEQTV